MTCFYFFCVKPNVSTTVAARCDKSWQLYIRILKHSCAYLSYFVTDNQEERRRQQAEAAEKRMKAAEGRGVKDPEGIKRKQQRMEEMEKKAAQSPQDGDGLRV